MTTNKPKIVAWLRNERGEHARGPATFDPMCIFGSPEPQGLVASYSPVVMFTDYEALQAECESLRAEMAEWKRVASAQAELHDEAEDCAEELAKALAELITWFPSADTYRRLGFDPAAPMRALDRARAALGRGGLSND